LLKEKWQKYSTESFLYFGIHVHGTLLLNPDTTRKAAFPVSEAVLSASHTDKDGIDQTK
jgi:hypothetical protein